jgi:molybdopterin converting factor small subunit
MAVTVDLTYDMSKAIGVSTLDLEDPPNVKALVQQIRERFESGGDDFEKLSRVAAVAVNGVLIRHRKGLKTPLAPGDRVAFVKAAAGG